MKRGQDDLNSSLGFDAALRHVVWSFREEHRLVTAEEEQDDDGVVSDTKPKDTSPPRHLSAMVVREAPRVRGFRVGQEVRPSVPLRGPKGVEIASGAHGMVVRGTTRGMVQVRFDGVDKVVNVPSSCLVADLVPGDPVRTVRALRVDGVAVVRRGAVGVVLAMKGDKYVVSFGAVGGVITVPRGAVEGVGRVEERRDLEELEGDIRGGIAGDEEQHRARLVRMFDEEGQGALAAENVLGNLVDEGSAPQTVDGGWALPGWGIEVVSPEALHRAIAGWEQRLPPAQLPYFFALRRISGIGVEVDCQDAVRWLERVDTPEATNLLGVCAEKGWWQADFRTLYRIAAERGSVAALFNFARVTGDMTAMRQAAEKGHPPAQLWTGELRWMRKAARQGMVVAQTRVGEALCQGNIVPRDLQEGSEWLERAVRAGYPEAHYVLGCVLLGVYSSEEEEIPCDPHRPRVVVMADEYVSRRLLEGMLRPSHEVVTAYSIKAVFDVPQPLAAAVFDTSLETLRTFRLREEQQGRLAIPIVMCSAEGEKAVLAQGATEVVAKPYGPRALQAALQRVANLREHTPLSTGWPHVSQHNVDIMLKDAFRRAAAKPLPSRAVELLRCAAECGHADAMNALGFLHMNGALIPNFPDSVEQGAHWYRRGADEHHPLARHNLAVCLDTGVVPLPVSEGLAWWWAFGRQWKPPTVTSAARVCTYAPEGDSKPQEKEGRPTTARMASKVTTTKVGEKVRVTGDAEFLFIASQAIGVRHDPCDEVHLGEEGLILDKKDTSMKLLFPDGSTSWLPVMACNHAAYVDPESQRKSETLAKETILTAFLETSELKQVEAVQAVMAGLLVGGRTKGDTASADFEIMSRAFWSLRKYRHRQRQKRMGAHQQ
eukprot:Sspe_Gene.60764::Locus_33544_Transcript_6_6_Confidence_0.500_Length_4303::g.60764::m.60764